MSRIILVLSLILSLSTNAIEVSNFSFGQACTDGKTFGWICHETTDVYVNGQGRCLWNEESKPCTWYGFQFDYKGYKIGDVIRCTYKTSEIGSAGNPREVVTNNSDSGEYSLTLDSESGHFYNPQYVIFSTMPKEKQIIQSESVCKFGGEELFRYKFNTHYPLAK